MAHTEAPTAPAQADPSPGAPERASPFARAFVAVYLIAFLACGAFAVEAWPLTGWRLFSHLRHAQRAGWQVFTVDRAGRQARVNFATFPRPDRHLTLIMRDYPRQSPAGQEAVCQAWAGRIRAQGRQVSGVRIYRTVVDLHGHRGRRTPPPPRRRLTYLCADGKGARAPA
ncbi:MAG: hypothetical protein M3Z33_09860 [Actinomycetota bacterium]|nr:hypothetical protein [Actinomycetota bacterium]